MAFSSDSGDLGIAEREDPTVRDPVTASSRLVLGDASVELLRTIAEVLGMGGGFPRVSEIVQRVLRHDALELVLYDRRGHVTLEARSPADLAGVRGCPAGDDEAFHIVSDLQRPGARLVGREADVIDDLTAAGYRSLLSIRSVAHHQVMRLGFFSKHPDSYSAADVPTAQHIADYVAVALAHQQLSATERDRAEARGRTGRLEARGRALADKGGAVAGRGGVAGRFEAGQRGVAKGVGRAA